MKFFGSKELSLVLRTGADKLRKTSNLLVLVEIKEFLDGFISSFIKADKKRDPKILEYLCSLKDIVDNLAQTLVRNPYYSDEKISGFAMEIATWIENFATGINGNSNITIILGKFQELRIKIIEDTDVLDEYKKEHDFFMENSLCKSKEMLEKKDEWVSAYVNEVKRLMDELDLKRDSTTLAFCSKLVGFDSAITLLPDIVSKSMMNAAIVMMQWKNKSSRINGNLPKKNDDIIMIDDVVHDTSHIKGVKTTMELNGWKLRAVVMFKDLIPDSEKARLLDDGIALREISRQYCKET